MCHVQLLPCNERTSERANPFAAWTMPGRTDLNSWVKKMSDLAPSNFELDSTWSRCSDDHIDCPMVPLFTQKGVCIGSIASGMLDLWWLHSTKKTSEHHRFCLILPCSVLFVYCILLLYICLSSRMKLTWRGWNVLMVFGASAWNFQILKQPIRHGWNDHFGDRKPVHLRFMTFHQANLISQNLTKMHIHFEQMHIL